MPTSIFNLEVAKWDEKFCSNISNTKAVWRDDYTAAHMLKVETSLET